MTRPLRLMVVEPDGSGGLVHYAYQLCNALAAAGHDVTLITGRHYELAALPHTFAVAPVIDLWPAVPQTRSFDSRTARAAARFARKARRVVRAFRYFLAWERLTRFLLRRKPDVVIFSVVRFPIQALWLRRLQRRGLVMAQICHEFDRREAGRRWAGSLVRRWDQAALGTFSAVFLHGEANRLAFHEAFDISESRTHPIPHGDESFFLDMADSGGDLRERYGLSREKPVALFFGGIRPSKGVPDLIEAFALARHEIDAALLIAGRPAGVHPAALSALAERLGVGDDVVLDPTYLPLSEVGPLLRTAQVVVLPYRTATASGVLQTAYAFERPVIVTDVGGLAEAVEDGNTGLVVPPADPAALARALVKILSDPAETERMGKAGRRLADRKYGWSRIAATIAEICRRQVGDR